MVFFKHRVVITFKGRKTFDRFNCLWMDGNCGLITLYNVNRKRREKLTIKTGIRSNIGANNKLSETSSANIRLLK